MEYFTGKSSFCLHAVRLSFTPPLEHLSPKNVEEDACTLGVNLIRCAHHPHEITSHHAASNERMLPVCLDLTNDSKVEGVASSKAVKRESESYSPLSRQSFYVLSGFLELRCMHAIMKLVSWSPRTCTYKDIVSAEHRFNTHVLRHGRGSLVQSVQLDELWHYVDDIRCWMMGRESTFMQGHHYWSATSIW
jgi:hypothetical protein